MHRQRQHRTALAVLTLSTTMFPLLAMADDDSVKFDMVVSAGAKSCLPKASGTVQITPAGPVEIMDVTVQGLPPNAEFDFFVIQVPKAPFGISWYQGDIRTNGDGRAVGDFTGIFSRETFILAPNVAPAPQVFRDDATANPARAAWEERVPTRFRSECIFTAGTSVH